MIQKIIHKILKRKVLFLPLGGSSQIHAAKSTLGFWYCGDLYNTADIAYGIARNGVVEKEETELVLKILKQLPEHFTLLDIGANTGYYGIMSAFLFPTSQTHSFEPIKEHCELIQQSTYLNRLSNVTVNEYALGEIAAKKDIYTAGSGTTLVENFTENVRNKITIEIKKLDDVVKEKQIQNILFIKIDVEGFEYEVLKGAREIFSTGKPILFMEICHTKDGSYGLYTNENFKKTLDFMEELGYTTRIQEGVTLRPFDKNTFPPKGVWMFLFIHPSHSSISL